MKIFIKIFLFISIVSVITLQSCFEFENYPPEPEITFMEFTFIDSIGFNHILRGELKFSFVDGDGNIGFGLDTPVQNTIFIKKYQIINNKSVPIDLAIEPNYAIQKFSTSGDRKPLKGEIVIKSLDEIPPINPNDTIMYKFYIVDRDYNYSNVDSTGYLILGDYLNK